MTVHPPSVSLKQHYTAIYRCFTNERNAMLPALPVRRSAYRTCPAACNRRRAPRLRTGCVGRGQHHRHRHRWQARRHLPQRGDADSALRSRPAFPSATFRDNTSCTSFWALPNWLKPHLEAMLHSVSPWNMVSKISIYPQKNPLGSGLRCSFGIFFVLR